MAPRLTHTEIEELLGAYAIDAVDPDEASAVEAHLVECPRCRAEVAEHREAATLLSFSGDSAPDELWSRISASLDDTPPPLEMGRVLPMRRRAATFRLVSAAAAVAAVLIAVLGVQVVRQGHRLDQLTASSAKGGLAQAAASAAVDPTARTFRLTSADGRAGAVAVVLPDGQGYIVDTRLPTLRSDETYQLWGVTGTRTVSLGLLGSHPTVVPFNAPGSFVAIAITAEQAGGVVTSTKTPVAQGALTTA